MNSLTPTSPFLDPPPEFTNPRTARICILPVPYDATTTYQSGSRFGPAALIAASHQVELYDEHLQRETYRVGIHTCPALQPNAAGPEAMIEDIRQACEPLAAAGKLVVLLGGEHTVTLGLIKALLQIRSGRPFGVVQFDAHRDLRSEYEGTPWNHACVMARILDWGLPLVQLGVRAWSPEEVARAKRAKVAALTARELLAVRNPLALLDRALNTLPDDVYLTFDLDALDPSIMPSTGTPEPGGLLYYPALDLIERIALRKRVIGLDVVELAPLPGLVAPDLLAARLLYRTLGWATQGKAEKTRRIHR
ncbi:MAG: agmatinase [Candidatus Sumerlaeia bacterium]|nr:agmatinase [Candidatus Sumerlaeia bacterium]